MLLSLFYGSFLVVFFLLYWFVVPARHRRDALLLASLFFFLFSFPMATMILVSMTLMVYGKGQMILQSRRKFWLVLGLLLPLGVLSAYKYSAWVLGTVNDVLLLVQQTARLPIPDLVIPLGISFFTFKFMHYLIDLYRGDIRETNFRQFVAYMLFFPTLASGPIERYQRFEVQTREHTVTFRWECIYEGLFRILLGLFKKVVIADSLTPFTDGLQTAGLSSVSYWIAAYAYAIKIYMDFSGYSDIAIGSARLFGYKIMENFNYPYFKRNLSLFWRNWHMSLTSWFRDYLFIPLGGSRVNTARMLRNIFIVWMATGIWHGAAWNFVLWGLFHAIGLIILKYYSSWVGPWVARLVPSDRVLAGLGGVVTFHYVVVGWVFFTCDVQQSFYVISRMLGLGG
ncbi:MBOAT family protein [Ammoniphilus sp. YIM 78166]|uniref:MBOAT family O-acyltransferase n=1 Tax=Ammoniphilus sp. YIM 78166 TaxID=1644106 RepID=UPI0010701765|nr:MBOAT family O-acyltransferase [Ammoniphilus sp. YIM 78166]